jgi:hypothetical protein
MAHDFAHRLGSTTAKPAGMEMAEDRRHRQHQRWRAWNRSNVGKGLLANSVEFCDNFRDRVSELMVLAAGQGLSSLP